MMSLVSRPSSLRARIKARDKWGNTPLHKAYYNHEMTTDYGSDCSWR
jgi:hypothetical protein